jgi:hypothetical protein
MKTGAKYQFFVPPNLAYGERAVGADISPNSTLIFEIELLDTKPAATPATSPAASPPEKTVPQASPPGKAVPQASPPSKPSPSPK